MITYLSFNDWCDVAWNYCQAYKKFGSATHIVYHDVQTKHHRQYCVAKGNHLEIQNTINKSKLLHFVGDEPITIPWKWPKSSPSFSIPTVPKVLTVIGSYFRRCNISSISYPIYSEREIMKYTYDRTVASPDLEYDWFKCRYIPVAYDTTNTQISWKAHTNKIIVGHSPTVRSKKGTDIILNTLSNDSRFELDVIENVTWQECMARKSRCHIFIEDLVSGIWGCSAIEAMACGIPTVSYLNRDFIKKYQHLHDVPIVACEPNKDSLMEAIDVAIANSDELSIKSRLFVEKVHSYEVVGQQLHDMYSLLV